VASRSAPSHSVAMPRPELRATAAALAAAFGDTTFTAQDAGNVGVPHQRLASATRAGLVHRLRRGHFRIARAGIEDSRLADCLERLSQRGIHACVGRRTAADIWDVPVWLPQTQSTPTVLVPRSAPVGMGLRGGVFLKGCDIDPRRIVMGPTSQPVTDPLLTAAHVASTRGATFAQAMVVLCGAMRCQLGWVSPEGASVTRLASRGEIREHLVAELRDAVTHADVRTHPRALAAVPYADPRLETALESLSWARFIEGGIDLPEPQVWVTGASGRAWRVDFLFGGRVIGECDGAVKYVEGDSLWKEKKRQSDLEESGYIVVRWTWEEIAFRPHVVLARIARALSRAV